MEGISKKRGGEIKERKRWDEGTGKQKRNKVIKRTLSIRNP